MEKMTLQEAIKILKAHQQWRLGNDDVVIVEPKVLTTALDVLLNYHIVETNEMVDLQNLAEEQWLSDDRTGKAPYMFTIGFKEGYNFKKITQKLMI